MRERFQKVQKASLVLQEYMAYYVCDELKDYFGEDDWWYQSTFFVSYAEKLPNRGTYDELVQSLDNAQLLQMLDHYWNDVFSAILDKSCRSWINELKGVRNDLAHPGLADMDQLTAERDVDTMARLCDYFSVEGSNILWAIHKEIREMDIKTEIVEVAPEESDDPKDIEIAPKSTETVQVDPQKEVNLVELIGTEAVQKTTLSRKVTFGGKTLAYPVYRVRLDLLKYNDRNDRISTWISKYSAENGSDALSRLTREEFNSVIEGFIYDSNPDSINKTQANIGIFGQREPGVTLSDGRVVDGNRRFTCLRRLESNSSTPGFFETVIMDVDIQKDSKQIKQLELAIQHGEEKKVDYDLIEYAIGTYRDVVQTKLLTEQEYAASTNEPVSEVRKRIACAEIICEFLNYIGLPEQYYVARELQVYSLFQEMMTSLNKLKSDEEKVQLKKIAFNNALLKGQADQRKFIRDISNLVRSKDYSTFFADQMKISEDIEKNLKDAKLNDKKELDAFVGSHTELTSKLSDSMERALNRHRNQQIKDVPAEKIEKIYDTLLDIDSRLFDKLSDDEKRSMGDNLDSIIQMATLLKNTLEGKTE